MSDYSIVYWISGCGVCGQGPLAIIKDTKYDDFSLICEDCEAEWKSPDISDETRLPRNRKRGIARNATWEEIKVLGWDKYVHGNYVDFDPV